MGSIPEAPKSVSGSHIFALMMAIEEKASEKGLSLLGHCVDSTTNSLAMLAIPDKNMQSLGVKYIGMAFVILHQYYVRDILLLRIHVGTTHHAQPLEIYLMVISASQQKTIHMRVE